MINASLYSEVFQTLAELGDRAFRVRIEDEDGCGIKTIERLPAEAKIEPRGAAVGLLLTPLVCGAGASAMIYGGQPGKEQPTGEIVTVYPWKLKHGEEISMGTAIDLGRVNGHWYVRNAAC